MNYRSSSLDRDPFPRGREVEAGYDFHIVLIFGVFAYKSTITSKLSDLAFIFDVNYPKAETMVLPMTDELKQCSFRLLYCRIDSVSDGVYHERIAMKSMQKKLVGMRRRP
nr:hypothetical protein [Mesorhizobium sp.]